MCKNFPFIIKKIFLLTLREVATSRTVLVKRIKQIVNLIVKKVKFRTQKNRFCLGLKFSNNKIKSLF